MPKLDDFKAHALPLAPFQLDLVNQLSTANRRARIVLQSPPGYGKSTTLIAAVEHLSSKIPMARVLVLSTHAAFLTQWESRLDQVVWGTLFRVDAPGYRRLQLETSPQNSPWSRP